MRQPKALLPWQGTTLIGYCIGELRRARVERLVVVLGAGSESILTSLDEGADVQLAYNLEVASGRSASIRIGAAAVADDCGAVLVQSVDQPCPSRVLRALFEAIESHQADVSIPTFEGRRGHPACFAGRLLPALRAVSEETQGLRAVVRGAAQVLEVPVDTESVRWNLNDPAAYAAAVAATAGH
jgi:molybdenum cofactor cytidylyltransferase